MHICIIGTGASGWIACTMLKDLDIVKKITIIGSSKIPTIGVGESTTLNFANTVLNRVDLKKFIRETDAAVKYGVYYKNWSKKDFIHYFKSDNPFLRHGTTRKSYGDILANKDPNTHIHDLIGNKLWNFILKNEISLDFGEYPHSWHFDAGKFISFLKNINLESDKVTFVDDTIVDCEFFVDDQIKYIIGEKNKKYTSDYFVNCCGDNELNVNVFKEEYTSLSSYLLTNKALVYPLKYKNKREQFHPYTVAKTMKSGWRWITPTQSRIGTGYVFSDDHISVDEATHEFINDVGDKTITPLLVDFNPKFNKRSFKKNSCSIGMSSGFLEPLDAPGLTMTIVSITRLFKILEYKNDKSKMIKLLNYLNFVNESVEISYQWWCTFILHQYKTCWRDDTQFWIDHKNVECNFYEDIIKLLGNVPERLSDRHEFLMLHQTTASKDVQWESKTKQKPFLIDELDTKKVHHLDFIESLYD
jgi:tryptophan halogenase